MEMDSDQTCSESTSCSACSTAGTCDAHAQERHMEDLLNRRLAQIKHRVVVMSGKGGVGKTTVAVNLAVALASRGKVVGILDADVHGPNTAKMLGLNGCQPEASGSGLVPITAAENVKVMSMAFMLPDEDTPVVWRGPVKHTLFKQFLAEVDWGGLDYLIVDLPPGTGDEPLSIAQLLGQPLWAVVVTTPQDVALLDSRKSVVFGRTVNMNVLGIVENMSGLICPHCGERIDLFKTGGGERSARDLHVPFLGAIPLDPTVVTGGDAGIPVSFMNPDSVTTKSFQSLAEKIGMTIEPGAWLGEKESEPSQPGALDPQERTERRNLRMGKVVAVPSMHPGGLEAARSGHFGHCDNFTLIRVDEGRIRDVSVVHNPPHQQGGCQAPVNLLHQSGADALIVGGIGMRPLMGFRQAGIDVYYGPEGETVGAVIEDLIEGRLRMIQEQEVCGGGRF